MSEEKSNEKSNKSFIENYFKKNSKVREKEFEKHKNESLKLSTIISLFGWLISGVLLKNIVLGASAGIVLGTTIFLILLYTPTIKKKKKAKLIEAQLPLFLLKLATEIKLGKSFNLALREVTKEESEISSEFKLVLNDMNKGVSFQNALIEMNKRNELESVKRALSSLSNLQTTGKKDVIGLKKLSEEMLLKQRIESKEFSGKMAVYSLVFIAISAIVPAMFLSFALIGSYFMKISFTPTQILLISVIMFPAIDAGLLMVINSKTPVFLKE